MQQNNESLHAWGWGPDWYPAFEAALAGCPRGIEPVVARVVGQEGPVLALETAQGTRHGLASGRFRYFGHGSDLPLVGDWVVAQAIDNEQMVVHRVLERKTVLSRAVSDGAKDPAGRESLLAANLDVLVIVTGLDGNFNPRRAQRLATLARHGGILPLWVLSKADLPGAGPRINEARKAAGSDPLVALSSLTGEGVDALAPWLVQGMSLGLVGSSGVGKTTLVNRLRGSDLTTGTVRVVDGKGRHTTTSRHLYRLATGALLMDTPGMRTVGLWAGGEDLAEAFSDIATLATRCRFPDCRHDREPGCAVRAALDEGRLEPARWDGWRRQEREVRFLESRDNKGAQRTQRDQWKVIKKSMRGFNKESRSGSA